MNIKQLFIVASIGMMFAACSSGDDGVDMSQRKEIKFNLAMEGTIPSTRAGSDKVPDNTFAEGTEVTVQTIENSAPCSIAQMKYSSSAWTNTSGSKLYYPLDGSNAEIYAMSPKVNDILLVFSSGFTVQSDQTSIEDYLKSDLLFAKLSQTPSESPITINMKHLCAKIVINAYEEGSINPYVMAKYTSVKISGVYLSGRLEPDGTFSGVGNSGSVQLGTANPFNQNHGVIPPQTVSTGTELFEVSDGTNTYKYTTQESIEFKSGYTYTFNLTIKRSELALASLTLSGWTDGGSKNWDLVKQ